MGRALRYAWAAPATAVGMVLALCACRGGRITVVDGVIEAQGPLLRWGLSHLVPVAGGAAALTFGHVVLARSEPALVRTRVHERVHVRQYERWGPLFVPAYLLASLCAAAQGRHYYRDNCFEREAFLEESTVRTAAGLAVPLHLS